MFVINKKFQCPPSIKYFNINFIGHICVCVCVCVWKAGMEEELLDFIKDSPEGYRIWINQKVNEGLNTP
jgi:hypothetical protein